MSRAFRRNALTVYAVVNRIKSITVIKALPAVYAAYASLRFAANMFKVAGIDAIKPTYSGIRAKAKCELGDISYVHNLHKVESANALTYVFIHGWGSSIDSAWFTVLDKLTVPYVAIDLPHHGESYRHGDFSLDASALAVNEVLSILEISCAHIVAHSMGGPVALLALRADPHRYNGVSMLASSVYYKTPILHLTTRLAGKVLFKRSPLTLRRVLKTVKYVPEHKEAIAWAWLTRPKASTLVSSAALLRNFDARLWPSLSGKSIYSLIPENDPVISPKLQKSSAEILGAYITNVPSGRHNFTLTDPDIVIEHVASVAERFASTFNKSSSANSV